MAGGQVGSAPDFEQDNGEFLSISDAAQTGLGVTGSLTLVGWMQPESLEVWHIPAAKYDYGSGDRGYRLDLRPGNA